MSSARAWLLGCGMLAVLASPGVASAAFKVVGYETSWSGNVGDIQWSKLTHVNYAFLNPNDGIGVGNVQNGSKLQSVVSAAHANGRKVLLSVGGWTDLDNHAFESYAASDSGRTQFANAMMTLVNNYGLDGIDIDWEYPTTGTVSQNYGLFIQRLCATLHSNGKLCTAAVAIGFNGEGVPNGVFGAFDWINIMAYDGGAGAQHSPYSLAVTAFDYWLGRGLPAGKAILGLPFYGRANDFSTAETYASIVARDASAPNKDVSNGIYYNGIATIKSKTTLAQQRGGGVMFWEMAGDTGGSSSLVSAIASVVGGGGGGGSIDSTKWYNVVNQGNGKCVDDAGWSQANGAVVHQWTCGNAQYNQEWQFQPTSGGYYRVMVRYANWLGWDVTGGPSATGNSVKVELWSVGSPPGANQEWKPVALGNGWYKFVARHSGRCLDVPGQSAANGVQLQQYDCNGTVAQSFKVVQQP